MYQIKKILNILWNILYSVYNLTVKLTILVESINK